MRYNKVDLVLSSEEEKYLIEYYSNVDYQYQPRRVDNDTSSAIKFYKTFKEAEKDFYHLSVTAPSTKFRLVVTNKKILFATSKKLQQIHMDKAIQDDKDMTK